MRRLSAGRTGADQLDNAVLNSVPGSVCHHAQHGGQGGVLNFLNCPATSAHRKGGAVPLIVIVVGTAMPFGLVEYADREGVYAFDPMHKARLPQHFQCPINGLRPTHPNRLQTRKDLIGGQGLTSRRAQHAEHQVLIA